MYLRSKTQGRLRCQKRRSLPQPVKIPQNHFHEYRQKVTVTTLFQTASHPDFQLLAQTAHVCFHSRKRVHTRLSEKNRTQGHTRRNRGVLDGGGITTLGAFRTFTNIPGPGIRTASFAAFGAWSGVLPKNAESLRDSDALMRVAVPRRRGPAGLRDLFRFCRSCGLYTLRSVLSECARRGVVSLPSACFACSRNTGRPLVKAAHLPFSEVG